MVLGNKFRSLRSRCQRQLTGFVLMVEERYKCAACPPHTSGPGPSLGRRPLDSYAELCYQTEQLEPLRSKKTCSSHQSTDSAITGWDMPSPTAQLPCKKHGIKGWLTSHRRCAPKDVPTGDFPGGQGLRLCAPMQRGPGLTPG